MRKQFPATLTKAMIFIRNIALTGVALITTQVACNGEAGPTPLKKKTQVNWQLTDEENPGKLATNR